MKNTLRGSLAAASLVVLALAGCSSTGGGGIYGGGPAPQTSAAPSSPSAKPKASPPGSADKTNQPALMTADSSLGTIVVDGKGMSVYVFDEDTPGSGSSACEGDCLTSFPAVTATDDKPKVEGVTGTVGTITRSDGSLQVTLNGSPLYLSADDVAAGDMNGQGVGGVWWLVAADGTKISDGAAG